MGLHAKDDNLLHEEGQSHRRGIDKNIVPTKQAFFVIDEIESMF
jgi:hypothetical protein